MGMREYIEKKLGINLVEERGVFHINAESFNKDRIPDQSTTLTDAQINYMLFDNIVNRKLKALDIKEEETACFDEEINELVAQKKQEVQDNFNAAREDLLELKKQYQSPRFKNEHDFLKMWGEILLFNVMTVVGTIGFMMYLALNNSH